MGRGAPPAGPPRRDDRSRYDHRRHRPRVAVRAGPGPVRRPAHGRDARRARASRPGGARPASTTPDGRASRPNRCTTSGRCSSPARAHRCAWCTSSQCVACAASTATGGWWTSARTSSARSGSRSSAPRRAPASTCGTARRWTTTATSTSPTCARRWPHDTYVLAGTGREMFEPRSPFHGFRYVEVTGYPGELTPDRVGGRSCTATRRSAGLVRLLRRAGQPAAAQHRVGPARQLPRRPDRLPAARRAAGLAGGRPGVRADRRFLMDVAAFSPSGRDDLARRAGAPTAPSRTSRRAARSSATARRPGRTPASSCRGGCTSATATRAARAPLVPGDGALAGPTCRAASNPDLLWHRAPRQRLRRLAVASDSRTPTARRVCATAYLGARPRG